MVSYASKMQTWRQVGNMGRRRHAGSIVLYISIHGDKQETWVGAGMQAVQCYVYQYMETSRKHGRRRHVGSIVLCISRHGDKQGAKVGAGMQAVQFDVSQDMETSQEHGSAPACRQYSPMYINTWRQVGSTCRRRHAGSTVLCISRHGDKSGAQVGAGMQAVMYINTWRQVGNMGRRRHAGSIVLCISIHGDKQETWSAPACRQYSSMYIKTWRQVGSKGRRRHAGSMLPACRHFLSRCRRERERRRKNNIYLSLCLSLTLSISLSLSVSFPERTRERENINISFYVSMSPFLPLSRHLILIVCLVVRERAIERVGERE